MIPLICKVQNSHIHRIREEGSGCQGLKGEGNGELQSMGIKLYVMNEF